MSVTINGTTGVTSPNVTAPVIDLTLWSIYESAGIVYFAYNGVNKAKLDSSGNLTVVGNVTAYGTV